MKNITLFFILNLSVNYIFGQCFISSFGSLGQFSKTTGNYALDSKFNNTKIDLESVFNVSVDLYIYDDGNSPNAFATTSNSYSVDGLVAFGQTMLSSTLWRMDKGEYAVAGVMAHEFAHILQIKKGCRLMTTQKELQADFLAGYYFGRRNFLSIGLKNFATSLYEIGDYNFWSSDHHGTPQERVDAMLAGYRIAYKSINEAYLSGMKYVTENSSIDERNENSSPSIIYENCSKCDGMGEIEVTKTCSICKGTGMKLCSACRGNGGYYGYGYNTYGQYGYWWFICSRCGGEKVGYCSDCDGTGTVTTAKTCYYCHGKGQRRKY